MRLRPRLKKHGLLRPMVARMAALGLTQDAVAGIIGISETTLKRRFGEMFKEGMVDYDLAVKNNLRRMALGNGQGAVTAAIYWTKVRLGWSEKHRIEHSFDAGMLQKMIDGFIDIVNRAVPDFCPGCNTALALKPKIATLLIEESAKLAATPVVPPVPEGLGA